MIASHPTIRPPALDDPWRRLPWLTPSALLLWALLLLGFAALLESARPPPESVERLDARLIEIPAAPEPGGLQGESSAAAPAPVVAPPVPVPPPPPHAEPKHEKPLPARPKVHKPAPATVYDSHGARTAEAVAVEAPAAEQPPGDGTTVTGGRAGAGRSGTGGGLGADSIGARALYAPVPKIPDDLREDVFETVAVAHFRVTFDGTANVSLAKPTTNPRLNSLLLDTLQQWKFAPAVRNGVAIDSAFDVRIPIVVQ